MPTLFGWNLTVRGGVPMATGMVSEHPKLPEGEDIHTSKIRQAEETENGLVLRTVSGSVYRLRAGEWSGRREAALEAERLGLSPDFWARCARAREEAATAEKADLRRRAQPGTLALRIVGTGILTAYWVGAGREIRQTFVRLHAGMFQDSYLIGGAYPDDALPGDIDFRVLPMPPARLEPYRMSEGIRSLLVTNDGCRDITFGVERKHILCEAGTGTVIPAGYLLEIIPLI